MELKEIILIFSGAFFKVSIAGTIITFLFFLIAFFSKANEILKSAITFTILSMVLWIIDIGLCIYSILLL